MAVDFTIIMWHDQRPIQNFSEGARIPKGGVRQSIIRPKFLENYMKMKKIGPFGRGGFPKFSLCRSATDDVSLVKVQTEYIQSLFCTIDP